MKTFNKYLKHACIKFKESVGGTAGDLGTLPAEGASKKKEKNYVPKKATH